MTPEIEAFWLKRIHDAESNGDYEIANRLRNSYLTVVQTDAAREAARVAKLNDAVAEKNRRESLMSETTLSGVRLTQEEREKRVKAIVSQLRRLEDVEAQKRTLAGSIESAKRVGDTGALDILQTAAARLGFESLTVGGERKEETHRIFLEQIRSAVRAGVPEDTIGRMLAAATAIGIGGAAQMVVAAEKGHLRFAPKINEKGHLQFAPEMPEIKVDPGGIRWEPTQEQLDAVFGKEASEPGIHCLDRVKITQLPPIDIKKEEPKMSREGYRVHAGCSQDDRNITLCGEIMSEEMLGRAFEDLQEDLELGEVDCNRCSWILSSRMKWECPCDHDWEDGYADSAEYHEGESLFIPHAERA